MKLLTVADSLMPITRMVDISATTKTAGALTRAPVRLSPAWAHPATASRTSAAVHHWVGALVRLAGSDDAELTQQAHQVARPAHPDRGGPGRVLQHQVPADDPGDELAHGGVGVGVGAARHRHRAGHLGVAEPRERRRRCRPGSSTAALRGRRAAPPPGPVRTKMPAPMMAPMPERGQVQGAQRPLERFLTDLVGFGTQLGNGLGGPQAHERILVMVRAETTTKERMARVRSGGTHRDVKRSCQLAAISYQLSTVSRQLRRSVAGLRIGHPAPRAGALQVRE